MQVVISIPVMHFYAFRRVNSMTRKCFKNVTVIVLLTVDVIFKKVFFETMFGMIGING